MAQDPRKSKFTLQKASSEARSFPTISLTNTPEGIIDPEDLETSKNPDASTKLSRLSKQGLNPLKPIIIANTEFVPVGDGTSPDSTGLKVQLGDNNLLSVNSVTKLFEIHRQVRLATIRSSETLLGEIGGYDTEFVLSKITEKLDTSFEDLVRQTLEGTIDAVISSLITPGSRRRSTSDTKNKQKKTTGPAAKRENKRKRGKKVGEQDEPTTSIQSAFENVKVAPSLNLKLKRIFENNKNDPALRTVVERAILEKILYDALKYLSGILSLKDAAQQRWSVYDSLDFNAQESKVSDAAIKNLMKLTFEQMYAGAGAIVTQDFSNVLKSYSGITASPNSPDSTLLIQFFMTAASSFLRLDDNMTEVISNEIQDVVEVDLLPKRSGIPTVKKSLENLSKVYLKNYYRDIKGGKDDWYISDRDNLAASKFNKQLITSLYSGWASDIDKIDIHGELLASSIYGDCIAIASHTTRSRRNGAFYSLGESIPGSIRNVEDYYRELIDFDKDDRAGTVKYSLSQTTRRGESRLVRYLSAKSSKSESLSNYIPLESTTNLESIHKTPYLTGPEYFYDVALQRGDENLTDFKEFAEKHNDFVINYANDIYNMTKLDFAIPATKKLLAKIGYELKSAEGGMDIFLLSLISYNAETNEGLIRLINSIYSASRLDVVEDKNGAGVGDNNETVNPINTFKGSRRVMRAANQLLVKNILYDGAGIKQTLKQRNNHSGRDRTGNKLKTNLKPKEYLEKDKRFSTVESGKSLVRGTGEDNSNPQEYIIHKQSGRKYGTPDGGLNKELTALEGGPNFVFNSSTPCPSIKYYLNNEHFKDAGLVSQNQLDSFNDSRLDKGDRNVFSSLGIEYQGTGVELSSFHRTFLLYSFVAKLINKSAQVYIKSENKSGTNNAKIKLKMSLAEIRGIGQAFIDVGLDQQTNRSEWADDKNIAYDNTREHLNNLLESMQRRISKTSAAIVTPVLHGTQLYNQYLEASKFIRSGDGSDRSRLAINLLKNKKIRAFDNSLDLLTDEGVAQIYKSYVTTFLRSKARTSFTREDVPDLNHMKLMMKILTTSGYGLLSSEKRGPKNICHVGVTNSLLSTLRYEAYKEFNDRRFLNSTKFCVNIFKRNEVDSQVLVYPKTFQFDSSLMLIDNDYLNEDLNHIKNFSDGWSFDKIIDNFEFTQWINTSNNPDDPFENLVSFYSPVYTKGSDLKSRISKDILINHIFDYAFKSYYRYALGLDLNENSFTLNPVRKNSGVVSGGLTVTQSEMQEKYDNLISETRLLYPAANVDQKLASELFRNIEIIAAHPTYALADKVKKIIYPKKFDKVLSMLVNEKDFVLYTDAYNKTFSDVFKTDPSFSFTSRIYRPDTKSASSSKDENVKKYIIECQEDFPEVFSMFASITILPGE